MGLLTALLFTLSDTIPIIGFREALLYFGLLPLPATLDWFSQTVGWRESTNPIRFITGWCYGMSLGICLGALWLFKLYVLGIALLIYGSYVIVVFYFLRYFDVIETYLKPYEEFLS